MFGIRFIKVPPTVYVIVFKGSRIVREGQGLAFFYYAPTTSLVAVPLGSTDAPFIFNEVTADFQEVTVQGQITYRIADVRKIVGLLNFTLTAIGVYASDDPTKLSPRVINAAKVLTQKELRALSLRDALKASSLLVERVTAGLAGSAELQSLGVEVLGVAILAIKPTPETARALEAEAREQILRESDEAIYARRNAAVQQERAIKENELNTEIAVEVKKRQIRETQMDAERSVQEKQQELAALEMASKTRLEEQNRQLVALSSENARVEADVKAYALSAVMKALADVDPQTVQAIATVGMESNELIALAFQRLAERAEKIGELNVSPDLLRTLIKPAR